MKGKAYEALEMEDGLGEKKGQDGSNARAVLWGCLLVTTATGVLWHSEAVLDNKDWKDSLGSSTRINDGESTSPSASPTANVAGHDTSDSSSYHHWNVPDPAIKFQPASALQRYHNSSFPGMNDTNTTLECCAARIIVELERHFSQNIAPPFTTLQFDNNNETMCGSYIESVENYPGCCGLPSNASDDKKPFGDGTIPFWVENCIPLNDYATPDENPYENANMTGFMVYYDSCPAYLLFDTRSCSDWINQTKKLPREMVQNVSLVNGEFTGMVVTSPNKHEREPQPETSIFIQDVFDSCWQVDCGWGRTVNTTSCIEFAQANLRKVSLAQYVDTIKHVWCE